MKKGLKSLIAVMMLFAVTVPAFAADASAPADTEIVTESESEEDGTIGDKAIAAAIAVGIAATAGAIAMGWAISKSVEGIARQPEAEGKIRTTLMLGLVFVETAVIYALVVAILIIFVL